METNLNPTRTWVSQKQIFKIKNLTKSLISFDQIQLNLILHLSNSTKSNLISIN